MTNFMTICDKISILHYYHCYSIAIAWRIRFIYDAIHKLYCNNSLNQFIEISELYEREKRNKYTFGIV